MNLLKIEASVRMNEYMDANDTENPKMVKWSKLFITNLFQMLHVFIWLEELDMSNECGKMIEMLCSCFFDRSSMQYQNFMECLDSSLDGMSYHLGCKNEMLFLIQRAINMKFNPESWAEFLKEEEQASSEFGYIPTQREFN